MAHVRAASVADISTTTGTGSLTLANTPPSGFRTVDDALASSDTAYFVARHRSASEWEVFLGTYSGSHVVARTTTIAGSNGTSAVNFGAGTKDVMLIDPAERDNPRLFGLTDNRLVRTDGTAGNIQQTGITVDDSDNVSGMATLTLPNTGLHILDSNATHDLVVVPTSNLTADRNLNIATGDADRTVTISADVTFTGNPVEQGLHTIWIPATAMYGRTTNGAASGTAEMATNLNIFKTLDFDTTTQEFAQFAIRMPKSWNEGTVTFAPVWSHPSTTTNFGVVWGLAGVAVSDDDAGSVAFGTAQTSTDTGGTTNDIYIGPTSAAITIAGTPQAEDLVMFQVNRTVANGSDTMAVDARLHGITLYMTLNAATDA
jgi:hypothetical protein